MYVIYYIMSFFGLLNSRSTREQSPLTRR